MELSDEREILPLRSHALVQGHLPMVVLEEQYPTVFFLGAGAWSKFCLSRGGLLHMPLKIRKKLGGILPKTPLRQTKLASSLVNF